MNTLKYTAIGICIIAGAALQGSGYGQEIGSPEGIKTEQSLLSRYTYVVEDMLRFCEPQKGFWIDLGAGKGQIAIPLIEKMDNPVTMLDPNSEAMAEGLDSAREKGLGDKLFAVVGVAEEMPFPVEKQPEITTHKEGDNVAAQAKGDTMTYTITSPRGIGSASITPWKGWAKRVVLRANLRGLESLAVSNGRVTLRASVLSHSGNQRLLSVKDGDGEEQVGQGSPYWMEIQVFDAKGKRVDGLPGQGGYFEMELPSILFDGQLRSLTVNWIDFYRR